ncbi:hypothetical protein SH501x_002265 [Pirellulaceae bacterium SH501]
MKTAHLHLSTQVLSIVFASFASSAAVAQRPDPVQPALHRVANHKSELKQTVAPIHRNKSPRGESTPYTQRAKPTSVDWTTLQSTYSHDENGTRLDQYSQGVQPVVALRPDYVKSGFRHTRSTLQAGFSSDNYHVVEQWGGDVRPYGEWRYPYRPFSVPYGMWGPQLPQVVGGLPWGGFPPHHGFHSPMNPNNPGGPNGDATPPFGGQGMSGPQGMFPGGFPGQVHPGVPNGFGYGGLGGGFGGYGGGFGVGPWNALGPMQDDYYPQAPVMKAPEAPQYAPLGIGLP